MCESLHVYLKPHLVCGMGKSFFLRRSAEKMKRVSLSVWPWPLSPQTLKSSFSLCKILICLVWARSIPQCDNPTYLQAGSTVPWCQSHTLLDSPAWWPHLQTCHSYFQSFYLSMSASAQTWECWDSRSFCPPAVPLNNSLL